MNEGMSIQGSFEIDLILEYLREVFVFSFWNVWKSEDDGTKARKSIEPEDSIVAHELLKVGECLDNYEQLQVG